MQSGWKTSRYGGHDMSIDLKKDVGRETLRVRLLNTGKGSKNHSKMEHEGVSGRLNVLPFIEFSEVPLSLLVESNTLNRIASLRAPSNGVPRTSEVLYTVLSAPLHMYMTREETRTQEWYIKPQVYATCTMKSLMLWIFQDTMDKKYIYKSLKLGMSVSAFTHVLDFLEGVIRTTDEEQPQISSSLKNNLEVVWVSVLKQSLTRLSRCNSDLNMCKHIISNNINSWNDRVQLVVDAIETAHTQSVCVPHTPLDDKLFNIRAYPRGCHIYDMYMIYMTCI
eukprot:GHVR01050583.1.p1 GENE.GHVR01050583.1~~GHVR01050583.1.p1  ORF type:complete len:279 (+),score=47.91 GHVR01050583.1:1185-2021(+)